MNIKSLYHALYLYYNFSNIDKVIYRNILLYSISISIRLYKYNTYLIEI